MTAETDPSKRNRTENTPAGDDDDMNTRPEIHSASTADHT
jgi:hypothetical protein